MVDNLPMISQVHFEQTAERLKIVIPVRRNWPYLLIYSVLVFMWLGMMVWGSIFLGQILFSGQSYRFLFAAMIVIMLLVLFRFGRFLGRQWATYLTDREVVFVNQEELIVRRPVSIWGNTDVYDMQHVTPVYLAGDGDTLAFDYGNRHVYFGGGLTNEARQALLQFLNRTYFSTKIQ
jgi:hypothetical protein